MPGLIKEFEHKVDKYTKASTSAKRAGGYLKASQLRRAAGFGPNLPHALYVV